MPIEPRYTIVPCLPEYASALPAIERTAATQFPAEDLPRHLAEDSFSAETFASAATEGLLWVALDEAREPVGFALVQMIDGNAHLEEIDVLPAHGRRGIGTALIAAVVRFAAERNVAAITLSTFRHVPWNAPYYARLGFVAVDEHEYDDGLRALRRHEQAIGLDLARRVMMRLDVERGPRR